jgi:SpoVK/Ycf46/Vps4 family AAA+-type ATPase
MGDYRSTKEEVMTFLRARTPLIIIESSERERVEKLLKEINCENSLQIYYYTDTKQVCCLGSESRAVDTENDPLTFISTLFKKNRNVSFSYGDIKRISDDNFFSRDLLNVIYQAIETNGTLMLITADQVWSRIAQLGMVTRLDLPNVEERKAYIDTFLDKYRSLYEIGWTDEDVQKAATLLSGFTEIQIENILSSTLMKNKSLHKEVLHELTDQKSRLYASIPSIQRVNINHQIEVSGLHGLKHWLNKKKKVFFATDAQLAERDLEAPKGILLAGVPGCGKSYSAKLIAQEWELPLYRFDIGTIYDKWVGESEKKMKEALEFIDNVSPCVLWIDEIEKAMSVSDASNDTGKRVMGQFLFWLQESKGKVFLVATANDITQLPIELFRKGRFSEVFFIDLPNLRERKNAIELYVRRSLHQTFTEVELEKLIALTDGFSYSDIEYAIKEVAHLVISDSDITINSDLVADKMKRIIPIFQSNPEVVSSIQLWGKVRAVPASYNEEDKA